MKRFILFICLTLSFLLPEDLHASIESFMTIGEVSVYTPETTCQPFNTNIWPSEEAFDKGFKDWEVYCRSIGALRQYWSFKLLVLPEIDRYLIAKIHNNVMSASEAQNEMRLTILEFEREMMRIEVEIGLKRLKGLSWMFPEFEFEREVAEYVDAIETRRQQKDLPPVAVEIEKPVSVKMKSKRKKK
jgi:hypothetical protein